MYNNFNEAKGIVMSENTEMLGILLDLKKDLKAVSEKVIELSMMSNANESTNKQNSAKIDAIESDMQFAKGSIALFKGIGLTMMGVAFSLIVSFGTWIFSTYNTTQLKLAQIEQSIAVIRSEMKQYNKEEKHERTDTRAD